MKGCNTVFKAISASLAIMMLASVMTACGNNNNSKAKEDEDELAEGGLKGYTLNVLSNEEWYTDTPGNLMYTEEANGDTIREAVYDRNAKVNAKYGLDVEQTYIAKDADLYTEVVKIVTTQDDAYQAVVTDIGSAQARISENIYNNALTLPYLKLDATYWNGELMESSSVNGYCGAATGDIMFEPYEAQIFTMYNTPLAADFDIENLYTVTNEGGWTYDRMMSEMEKVITDLNNDGKYGFTDRIGLLYASNSCGAYYTSAGISFIGKDSEGQFYYDTTVNEKAEMLAEKAHQLIHSKGYACDWLVLPYEQSISTIIGMIENKQLLFQNMIISQVRRFYREIKTDFGILPLPKLSDEQSDYYVGVGSSALAVPASNSNLEKTGFALEALARYSSDFPNTYYHVALESKFTRDAESIEMITLANKNKLIDPIYIYDFAGFSSAIADIIVGDGSFTTTYANYADDINIAIEELMTIENG